jgi:hypothetical protein
MSDEITSISGLGPASAQGFARAGVTSAQQLRALGAHKAYRAWLESGNLAHFIGYYALHMALQGRPWNDCRGNEKTELRLSFDALCAEVKAALPPTDKGRTRLDAALDEIGLREKR